MIFYHPLPFYHFASFYSVSDDTFFILSAFPILCIILIRFIALFFRHSYYIYSLSEPVILILFRDVGGG